LKRVHLNCISAKPNLGFKILLYQYKFKTKKMTINFEYHDVEGSERLEAYTTEKLEKLYNKFQMIVRADVFFKTENTSSDNTGMICNIRLSVPGPRLFAEASHDNFISSINESVKDLDTQLNKKKDKMSIY
jgi:putative sigma-54 modulation protein